MNLEMNYLPCAKCGLNLPRNFLFPIIVVIQGQKRRVLICQNCENQVKKERNEKRMEDTQKNSQ